MQRRFFHPRAGRAHPAGGEPRSQPAPASDPDDVGMALARADRACCCLARPVVMVVLAPTRQRPNPVDLLLCGHHYHVSRDALAALNATVYKARAAAEPGPVAPLAADR